MSAAMLCTWIISVWNPAETAFLLSNLGSLLKDLSRKTSGKFSLFDPIGLCVKVMGTILLIPICAICIAVANGLLYMGLPTSWFRVVESFGLLNVESEYAIWWLILFMPLEFVTGFSLLTTAAFVCAGALIGLQSIKTYGENVR